MKSEEEGEKKGPEVADVQDPSQSGEEQEPMEPKDFNELTEPEDVTQQNEEQEDVGQPLEEGADEVHMDNVEVESKEIEDALPVQRNHGVTFKIDSDDVPLAPDDGAPPMAPPPAIFVYDAQGGLFEELEMAERIPSQEQVQPVRQESQEEGAAPEDRRSSSTYPFRAKYRTEKDIVDALRKTPTRQEYHGFLFSSHSKRPPSCIRNYFLPIYTQPWPKQHVKITGIPVPSSKIHSNNETPGHSLPLATIKVRWPSGRTKTIYRLESIYAYLSRFGPIDAVYSLTVNSAYVVFCDLEAAKAAVLCPYLGQPWDRLIALWAEPRLHNSEFYRKYSEIEKPPLRVRV